MEKRDSNKGLITALIVVVVVFGGLGGIACVGVLAAIAIPSFTRYVAQSKVAEAKVATRQMADFAARTFETTCAFPEPLPPTSDPTTCCGGERCAPNSVPAAWAEVATLGNPSYFSYSASPTDLGYTVRAVADFTCGGAQHTETITIIGVNLGPSSCSTERLPQLTENELQ